MKVEALDATLGARVSGVNLANLTEAEWLEVYSAFLEFGVLIFGDQHLSDDEQGAFAERFGEIERLSPKQRGGTIPISNQRGDGSLAVPGDEQYKVLRGNEGWHADSTYMPLASKAAMLAALVVPEQGGETGFADMRAAWDALSPALQQRLEGLSAYHSLYYSQARAGYHHSSKDPYGFHDQGAPLRPVVKVHPETGRRSIYTGRHAHGIPGLSAQESEQLLDQLMVDACQSPRVYIHKWRVGDLVVWDNRCVMHRACPYDPAQTRVLRGSRIAGDPATELAPTFEDPSAQAFQASQPR